MGNYLEMAMKRWARNTGSKDSKLLVVSERILDDFLGLKVSEGQQKPDEETHKILSMYVATLRALVLVHQQNHWATQHYGDHLLFERLYDDVTGMVDDAAERVVGLCGSLLFQGTEAAIAKKFEPKDDKLISFVNSSLDAEKAFQEVAKSTYSTLKEKDVLTLGLDDLIMSQASEGEVHLYLLQQAGKGYS